MSEAMIKRWNEIPLNPPDGPATASSKRTRARSRSPSNSDESEDNVSIISRSPSPVPLNQKEEDISIYDRYVRGPVQDPVTVDTKISSANKGFGMLAKMGWKEGEGLGVSGQGRRDPIPFLLKLDALGLGKASQDERVIESTVSQRRGLDSERMIKETEEQRKQREEAVAAKELIKTEVKDVLRSFFCIDCEKQYSNVAQYDEHIRSYAHTHVVRMKEQQATARQRQAGEAALRKAKEKKREEKEMRKMAAAAGIKLPTAPTAPTTIVPASQPIIRPALGSGSGFAPVADPPARRGGWTAVSTVAETSGGRSFGAASGSGGPGFKKAGWAATAAPSPASVAPEPVSVKPQSTGKTRTGFTRGGWTTLETTAEKPDTEMASPTEPSTRFVPPPPPEPDFVPPPPPSSAFDPPPPPPDDVPPPPPSDRYEPLPAPPSNLPPRGPSGGYTHNARSWNSGRRW